MQLTPQETIPGPPPSQAECEGESTTDVIVVQALTHERALMEPRLESMARIKGLASSIDSSQSPTSRSSSSTSSCDFVSRGMVAPLVSMRIDSVSSDETLTRLPALENKSKRRIGDPFKVRPDCFGRSPMLKGSMTHFDSFALPGSGRTLADGFKDYYPGKVLVEHDVGSVDWRRFLEDIKVAGRLSGLEKWKAAAIPAPLILVGDPFGPYFIARCIRRKWKGRKEPSVIDAIEVWAKEFFVPRGLDVFVVRGRERLSSTSPEGPIPSGFDPESVKDLSQRSQPLSLSLSKNPSSSFDRDQDLSDSEKATQTSSSSSCQRKKTWSKEERAQKWIERKERKRMRREESRAEKCARKARKGQCCRGAVHYLVVQPLLEK